MSEGRASEIDAELVSRCVEDGAADAFETLMERHHERIYSVILRLVQDSERARDLTQETFLKAWRGLAGFQGSASFYTWVYRIARNIVSSDVRRTLARPRIAVSLDDGGERGSAGSLEVVDPGHGPGHDSQRRERQTLIVAAIQGLVDDFREVIVLRDVEEHSYEEIAEMLEVPVGTVRSRLHRARLELKAKLADVMS